MVFKKPMKKISTLFLLVISNTWIAFAGIDITFNFSNAGSGVSQINNLVESASGIVGKLVPLMIGLAMVAFFWYLVVFISKGDESADKRQEGVKGMGYSLFAIFVMVALWGIIALLANVLGVNLGVVMPAFVMPHAQ
jgi:uncharacterized membrane protein